MYFIAQGTSQIKLLQCIIPLPWSPTHSCVTIVSILHSTNMKTRSHNNNVPMCVQNTVVCPAIFLIGERFGVKLRSNPPKFSLSIASISITGLRCCPYIPR